MAEFLQLIVSFPTVIYTVLLGVATLYWMFAIMGAVDVDLLDLDVDFDIDGAEGALEGADGAFEGAEGAFDGAEGAFDGAEGAFEGADGIADGADGADAFEGIEESGSMLASMFSIFMVRGVPMTVSLSVIFIINWFITGMGTYYAGLLDSPELGLGRLALFAGAFVVSIPMMRLALLPLSKILVQSAEERHITRDSIIGDTAIVRTGSVDSSFGQARVEIGGTELLVNIRCDRENSLGRGDEVLIIGYDEEDEAYAVEPMGDLIDSSSSSSGGDASADEKVTLDFDERLEAARKEHAESQKTEKK
jgi:hypothetical protein